MGERQVKFMLIKLSENITLEDFYKIYDINQGLLSYVVKNGKIYLYFERLVYV